MTHHLLEGLAAQRQSDLARRAAQERHTAPTRPAAGPRRTRRTRSLAVLSALVNRA